MAITPRKIGKYPVTSKLAEGGMGAVFLAEHPTLLHTVIIKKLTLMGHPALEERFRREARLMMNFRDERIVQVYDHFKEGSSYYIVMEYVEGIDLLQLLREKRYLPNDIAILIYSEVCKALKYAHEHNVIHRDIKPGNILISKSGKIKLTDFGVAVSSAEDDEDELTGAGVALGTPSYMSPEQIEDSRSVDGRADIYSLSVMLYEMLTGAKPYRGGFTPENISKITKGQYLFPRKINPKINWWMQRLIKKGMHHKLKWRYKNVDILIKKTDRVLKHYPEEHIEKTIQSYVQGKDFIPQRVTPLKSKLRIAGVSLALIFGIAGVWGGFAYQQGLHHEMLHSEKQGALIVEALIRKQGRAIQHRYLSGKLYKYKKSTRKWWAQKNITFQFSQKNYFKERHFYFFQSKKQYLPVGKYLLRLNIDNEQFQQQFYLASRTIQKERQDWKNAQRIRVGVKKEAPKLPLNLYYQVVNTQTRKNITDESELLIFRGVWLSWKKFIENPDNQKKFVTGVRYRFLVIKKGFYTREVRIKVPLEQTILNLYVKLRPKGGILSLSSKEKDLEILLNNQPYYREGGKNPIYKNFQPLTRKTQKVFLSAGSYILTLREKKSLWQRMSFFPPEIRELQSVTQKITIEPSKILRVTSQESKNYGLKLLIR
ncbi:MAG: serine/threonine protein kinase [bacterium]|jgi:serine/threonine protein kinase